MNSIHCPPSMNGIPPSMDSASVPHWWTASALPKNSSPFWRTSPPPQRTAPSLDKQHPPKEQLPPLMNGILPPPLMNGVHPPLKNIVLFISISGTWFSLSVNLIFLMYHSHHLLLIQSILVFSIASDENLAAETRDFRGKAACYTPWFPKISWNFLWIPTEAAQRMEIHGNRKIKKIYGNLWKYHVITYNFHFLFFLMKSVFHAHSQSNHGPYWLHIADFKKKFADLVLFLHFLC